MDKDRAIYIAIIVILGIILFGFDLYYFNYVFFKNSNLGSGFIESRAPFLQTKLLFKNPIYLRFFIVLLVTIGIMFSKIKPKLIKEENERKKYLIYCIATGGCYIFLYNIYYIVGLNYFGFISIITFSLILFLLYIRYLSDFTSMLKSDLLSDRFQKEARKFDQEKNLIENEYSVNIKTEDGWINIVNPFRASQVLGTPGSGKSYSFLIEALIQHINKGFTMLLYDYKYPSLGIIAYNAWKRNNHIGGSQEKTKFCVLNFDDLSTSNRCNPIDPELMTDSTDATAASQAIMYALYPKWTQKQGDFFVESAINFVALCIWTLKNYDKGQYCSIPHLIQFTSLTYDSMFQIMKEIDDEYIKNVGAPFLSAHDAGATDQLEGQLGTVRIALSKLTSTKLYWVLTTNYNNDELSSDANRRNKIIENLNVSLEINNPKKPVILVLANNPDKASAYSPIISIFTTITMRKINKQKQHKCAIIYDEFPTLSFPPGSIDNLIATARSNKIGVWIGFQDFAQLTRDLGKEVAEAIINTVGNTFSGMVNFDSAKKLSEKFGKIKITKDSLTVAKESNSMSISTQMEDIITPSEISSLPQGEFVGQVADDRGFEIQQKVFYSKIIIDHVERAKYDEGIIEPFLPLEDDTINEMTKNHFLFIRNQIKELGDRAEETYRLEVNLKKQKEKEEKNNS